MDDRIGDLGGGSPVRFTAAAINQRRVNHDRIELGTRRCAHALDVALVMNRPLKVWVRRIAIGVGVVALGAAGFLSFAAWQFRGVLTAMSSSYPRTEGTVRSAPNGSTVWMMGDSVASIRTIGGFKRDTLLPDSVMVFVAQTRRATTLRLAFDSQYVAVIDPVRNWRWPITIRIAHREAADTVNQVGYLVLEPEQARLSVYLPADTARRERE